MKSYSIVGIYHAKAEDVVRAMKPGDSVILIREPNNQYDRNAISVWFDGRRIGYIPKKQNAALALFIDQTGTRMPEIALDSASAADGGPKTISAKFGKSPNSSFPLVGVEG